ncbi:MAG: hypothetical protein R2867_41045 [Caldilineaceae bacterium]
MPKAAVLPPHPSVTPTLDLQPFDGDKFAAITAQVEATGIRLTSFAEVDQTEENIRKLYDINGVAAR